MAGSIQLIQNGGPHWKRRWLLTQQWQRCVGVCVYDLWPKQVSLSTTPDLIVFLSPGISSSVNNTHELLPSVPPHLPAAAPRLCHREWGGQHHGHWAYHVEQLPSSTQARHAASHKSFPCRQVGISCCCPGTWPVDWMTSQSSAAWQVDWMTSQCSAAWQAD